ncbi:MAG TPA: DUF6491 family protein [Allosphingosinicella sp.]|nr:DUF6491 family protein [Allosphingosinicella sp.]
MMKTLFLAVAAAAALAGGALAASPSPGQAGAEVSVPFSHQRIRSFRSLDDRSVYLRVGSRSRGEWYRATTLHPCMELPYALAIGIADVSVTGTLDRFSTLLVDGQRCPLQSLVRSGPPPKKVKSDRYRSARRG